MHHKSSNLKTCPKCHAAVTDPVQCPECQIIFSKFFEAEDLRLKIAAHRKLDKRFEKSTSDDHGPRLLVYPVALILSVVFSQTILKYFVQYFRVWAHEFGHALMAWMIGIKATPLSFGGFGFTFNSGLDRSLTVSVSFIFLMGVMIFYGKRNKAPFLTFMASFLTLGSLGMLFIMPEEKTEELIVAAGFGGEMLFGALFVIAFYHRFPERWHWEHFFRWPFVLIGFSILTLSTSDWWEVYKLHSLSPFGANYAEEFGDLNRLMLNYDWPYRKFLRVYLSLCALSWLAVFGHYLYFLRRGKS